MSYAIVFSSKTGNTKLLADTLHACLPQENCCYFGTPDLLPWKRTTSMWLLDRQGKRRRKHFGLFEAAARQKYLPFWHRRLWRQ